MSLTDGGGRLHNFSETLEELLFSRRGCLEIADYGFDGVDLFCCDVEFAGKWNGGVEKFPDLMEVGSRPGDSIISPNKLGSCLPRFSSSISPPRLH